MWRMVYSAYTILLVAGLGGCYAGNGPNTLG